MKIRLGLHLDGQRGWHPANRLGYATLGPLGMLGILEAQLGVPAAAASQSERIVQYRDCLQRVDGPKRFYHRSFAADELGTAATLLGWRDQWHLNGWSTDLTGAGSQRLRDMAAVEELARSTVAPGLGERLADVLAAQARRKTGIDEVELVDPLSSFPLRWQAILRCLPVMGPSADAARHAGAGQLGELQDALLRAQAGEKIAKRPWNADGTVQVARAETRFLGGGWMAEQLGAASGDGLLVASAEASLLDGILVTADGARQGFREASEFRPTLQVLPLALEILWEPLNFYGLLQFLTHPVCPVSGYARRKLAGKLADKPGIGGESWSSVLQEIDVHFGERATKVREEIERWVEHPRYVQDIGAPIDALLRRVNHLAGYFRVRLGDDDRATRIAFNAGFNQCLACADALSGLLAQGMQSIRPRQLQQLVAQATARGSENPLLEPEVGALMSVTDPAAVIETFESVYWWQLALPPLPAGYPWSSAEIVELAAAGVALPPTAELLDRAARDWLKPILAARKKLVLVLPPKDVEVHPVWLMIEALFDAIPVAPLETILTASGPTYPAVPCTPLPARKRWWQLPAGVPVAKKGRDSFSSLELQMFNPYQWLLRYPAALNPSRILAVSSDFRLLGNLAHGLTDRFFSQDGALAMPDPAFVAWFEPAFDQIIREEGAVLLLPGRRSDLESFRIKLRDSLRQLRQQLNDAKVSKVASEVPLDGHYAGGDIHGYADLVLAKPSGAQAIVDMKWAGTKKYPEKLRENRHLQLAIYGELLRQQTGTWPAVAYYILESGQLFALDANYFASAQAVIGKTDEGTPELWLRFIETWRWRKAQIDSGRFEVVLEGIAEDTASEAPPEALAGEILNPDYNDHLRLAGWEETA